MKNWTKEVYLTFNKADFNHYILTRNIKGENVFAFRYVWDVKFQDQINSGEIYKVLRIAS